ncbi:hypothetical protein BDV93DRAFT_527405 [Ceratobasidium sp. AG-I]|nr:hypothetical protein BDV93DRAFT_527405 [Ceratobasidium sp. AG-I]
MPGIVAPSPEFLMVCFIEAAAMLDQLGNSLPPVKDALAEPLGALLAQPAHTVQVATARTLYFFYDAASNRFGQTVTTVLEHFQNMTQGLGTTPTSAGPGRCASSRIKARISPVPVECVALSISRYPRLY